MDFHHAKIIAPVRARLSLAATLVLVCAGAGSASEFHAAPGGNASGDGSSARPWDLSTALNSRSVAPGDTVWMHGGTYAGYFASALAGTAASPIKVKQWPGERATIKGKLDIFGSYTWYQGFEVAGQSADRTSATNLTWTPNDVGGPGGIDVQAPEGKTAPGNKLINLVVHDGNNNGLGIWSTAPGTEAYGNVVFYSGWIGSDRPHAHNIYTQNLNGSPMVVLQDNFLLSPFVEGLQAYGSSDHANNYHVEGTVMFNGGIVARVAGGYSAGMEIGAGAPSDNLEFVNNYAYGTNVVFGYGFTLNNYQNNNLTVKNNMFMGGTTFNGWKTIDATGNTFCPAQFLEEYRVASRGDAAINRAANTILASAPTSGKQVIVRPNKYEAKRANIVIFNWDKAPTVSVDLGGVLAAGDKFEIRDAQNFLANPVVAGTYQGPVSIPMTGLTAAVPLGYGAQNPGLDLAKHSAPTFGTFVVMSPTGGGVVNPPNNPPNVSPTIALTAPANGKVFTAPAQVAISANANDSDGSVSKVEFFQGATLIGTDNTAPYSVTWSNVGAGTYVLTAKATDNAGASTTSAAISITVNSVVLPPINKDHGLLRVHPGNTRYFTDGTGRAIYLTGSHHWDSLQDRDDVFPPRAFDYGAYLDLMAAHQHNFMRMWCWEQSRLAPWSDAVYIDPLPFSRTGPGTALDGKPKFDLTQWNQAYFDRLRSRIIQAGDRGIYVSVMLFQGWSFDIGGQPGRPWPGHPFHRDNNVNGINGDLNGDGNGYEVHTLAMPAVTALQEAYVRKVIDTVNDLDNVLYEIGNEENPISKDWQYHLIRSIKSYESTKAKQHMVGMTGYYAYLMDSNNSDFFASPADWISPLQGTGQDYMNNPPAATGEKVIIIDSDHLWGVGGNRTWIWKSFARGLQPIFMDPLDDPSLEGARRAMGAARAYADRMNLAAMTPQGNLSSTAYCLASSGSEYLIYQPGSGTFSVAVQAGTYAYEWFNPAAGAVASAGSIMVAGASAFTPPFGGDAVLYLKKTGSVPLNQPPTVSLGSPANGATYTSPATITITASAADSDGAVSRVDFYQGSTLVGTDSSAPYSISWSGVGAGTYALTAKATDNLGAVATSASATISITDVVVPSALRAVDLGITGEDRVGQQNSTSPNGVADFHLSLSGLRATPSQVTVTSDSGGIWQVPYNGSNWIIATQYSGSNGDLWFEPYSSRSFHVKVRYPDGTTDEADASPRTVAGSGTGLTGRYFDNVDFTGASLTRTDATVAFDWGTGSPDASLGAETFSVRWTGQVQAPFSETYTISTVSDDGVRLWIDGMLLIDNWTDHPPVKNSGTITLAAGRKYDLRMDYFENGGGATALLLWRSASISEQIIPRGQLYPAAIASGLQQGCFETPAVGAAGLYFSFQYSPTGSAWTFADGGGITANGSGFTFGNPNAPEGAQAAFIQGTGSASQSVSLAAGTYALSFRAAQRLNFQATSQTLRVKIDGQSVGDFRPSSGAYETAATAAFTVSAGSHTISIVGVNPNGGDNTAFVDDVVLVATAMPVARG